MAFPEGSPQEEASESPAVEKKEQAAGKGDAKDKKKPKRKPTQAPNQDDMKAAILRRLQAAQGGGMNG